MDIEGGPKFDLLTRKAIEKSPPALLIITVPAAMAVDIIATGGKLGIMVLKAVFEMGSGLAGMIFRRPGGPTSGGG